MKTKLLLFTMVLAMGVFAQKPKVTTASMKYQSNDIPGAKQYIDEAEAMYIENGWNTSDLKTLAKFYYLQAEVYLLTLDGSESIDKVMLDKCENAIIKCIETEKAIGKKPKYTAKVQARVPILTGNLYLRKGTELNNAEDYAGAAKTFYHAYELGMDPMWDVYSKTDTSLLFNAGLMTVKAEDFAGAAPIFEQLVTLGYNGYTHTAVLPDGSEMAIPSKEIPNIAFAKKLLEAEQISEIKRSQSLKKYLYENLIFIYDKTDNEEKKIATLQAARAEYPNEVKFINMEIDGYLQEEKYDEALAILDKAIATDPNNKIYYWVKGNVLQKQKDDTEAAVEQYKKALEIDPEYADVLYMTGVAYYDNANKVLEEINALPLNAKTKHKELTAQKEEILKVALGYFERAYAVAPDDKQTVHALKEVYYRLGMNEKALEFNKIYQGME